MTKEEFFKKVERNHKEYKNGKHTYPLNLCMGIHCDNCPFYSYIPCKCKPRSYTFEERNKIILEGYREYKISQIIQQ